MNFFEVIQVALCGRCTLNCIMCGQPRIDEHMDTETLKNLNRDLLSFDSPPILALAVRGEPLSHPFFPDALEILSRKSVKGKFPYRELYIDTNGQFLTVENSKSLLNIAEENNIFIRLTISTDGGSKETYSRIRKNGDFDLLFSNIDNFLRLRKSSPSPALNFQFIVMKENIHEIDLFIDIIKNKLGKYSIIPKITGKYPENTEDSISFVFHHPLIPSAENMENSKILHHTVLNKLGIEHPPETVKIKKETCIWPFYMLVVRENGNIIPCCLDTKNEMIFGNINKKPLKKIIEGVEFTEFRMNHIKTHSLLPQKCINCEDQLVVEKPGQKIELFLKKVISPN